MAIVAGSAALVPVPATLVPSERHKGICGAVVLVAFSVGMTVFWLVRWPTRRQSLTTVVVGVLCIAGWSFIQPTPGLAALACTSTALTGGYIALFHSPKVLLFNGVVAVLIALVAVLRLAHETSITLAVVAFWDISLFNMSVPLAIWVMSHALGIYAQRSEEDPLTGLLNRRAFTEAVKYRLADSPSEHTHLTVIMVDLDNFKRINDTHGHSAGDRTLRAVAELMLRHAPPGAAVCRAGGEEFLIALTCIPPEVRPLTARFCDAIAQLSPRVTASIGTARAELHTLSGSDTVELLEDLITIADMAMYAAKRRGGNQAHDHATL